MSNFESFLLNLLSTFYTPVSDFEVISNKQSPQTNSSSSSSHEETNVWIKYPLLAFLMNKLENNGFLLRRTNDTCLVKYKRNFDFETFPEPDVARQLRSFCFDPQALINNLPSEGTPTQEQLRQALQSSYLAMAPPKAEDYQEFVKSLSTATDEDKKSLRFEEFVDGVMINKFFHPRLNQWMIATRSIVGGQNNINNKEITIEMMFKEASENCNLTDDKLNKDYCYSFVLCHPEARVVKFYPKATIVLVDTFDRTKQFQRLQDYQVEETNLCYPEVFQMTLQEMEKKLESGKLPFDFQGYVIRLGDRRTRVRNQDFEYARSMRLSESDPVMRFLYLRRNRQIGSVNNQPNIPKGWLNYFPEDNRLFERLRHNVQSLTNNLLNYYLATNCYHEGKGRITSDKVPHYLRPLCKLLHNHYLNSEDASTGKRQATTERSVIQFVNTQVPIFEVSRALVFQQLEIEELQKKQLLEAQDEQLRRQEARQRRYGNGNNNGKQQQQQRGGQQRNNQSRGNLHRNNQQQGNGNQPRQNAWFRNRAQGQRQSPGQSFQNRSPRQ